MEAKQNHLKIRREGHRLRGWGHTRPWRKSEGSVVVATEQVQRHRLRWLKARRRQGEPDGGRSAVLVQRWLWIAWLRVALWSLWRCSSSQQFSITIVRSLYRAPTSRVHAPFAKAQKGHQMYAFRGARENPPYILCMISHFC